MKFPITKKLADQTREILEAINELLEEEFSIEVVFDEDQ